MENTLGYLTLIVHMQSHSPKYPGPGYESEQRNQLHSVCVLVASFLPNQLHPCLIVGVAPAKSNCWLQVKLAPASQHRLEAPDSRWQQQSPVLGKLMHGVPGCSALTRLSSG